METHAARLAHATRAEPPQPVYALHRVESVADWGCVAQVRDRCGHVGHEAQDGAVNAITFLLEKRGTPVGTTRTMVSSAKCPGPLPALAVFRREIDAAVGLDATLVEAGRTSVDPAAPGDSRTALFHLFKAHMLHCILEDADCLLMAVREAEIGFYQRMLSMEMLSGPEHYPGSVAPRVLMGLDVRARSHLLVKRIPMIAVTSRDYESFRATGRLPFGGRDTP